MTSLTVFNFGSQDIRFEQRGDRVWGCLTDMAAASGKLVADWLRLKSTTDYLDSLKSFMGIPIISENTGTGKLATGTWGIEEVVLKFAAWCSVEFEVWVYRQIKTLLTTGKVELVEPKKYSTLEKAETVTNLIGSLHSIGMDLHNPRFNQDLQDLVGDILGLTQPQLPGEKQVWLGVAERAEQLGYPVGLVTKNRSQLGKYVKCTGLEPRREKRLCGGTQREINLYPVSEELDRAITEFLDAKVLAQ